MSFVSVFLTIVAVLVPFSYYEIGGVRFAPVVLFMMVLALFFRKVIFKELRLIVDRNMVFRLWASLFIFIFSLLTSAVSGNFNFTLSLVVFFIFLLWPIFLDKNDFSRDYLDKAIRLYVYGALFCSLGVIFQYFAFFFWGKEFFRVAVFGGGRTAFSFIWQDFSFISLYLVSAVPLSFYSFNKRVAFLFLVILFFGSVVTSARTGIASGFLFLILLFLFNGFRAVALLKIGKRYLALALSSVCGLLLYVYLLMEVGVRSFTVSGSGRLEGHLAALTFFKDNFIFGSYMDPLYYSEKVGIIPHHILTYTLVMGGIVFLLLFVVWISSFYDIIFSKNKFIASSIVISLIGFNFIPSFYSAYFLAFLLSLSILNNRLYSLIAYDNS